MAYKQETIREYIRRMKSEIDGYITEIKAGVLLKVSISTGNRKIGRVMNVSTAPIITCGRNCRECKGICYDIKACLQYGNVMKARARNTAMATVCRDEYFRQIDEAMSRRRKNKYFRFHVGGEIMDSDYFCRMLETARKHPDFKIWTYTKQYHVVNEYVAKYGRDAIPANMVIMFSEWRGLPMVNPYGFPEFRVVFKTDPVRPVGYYCPGNCDICKAANRGCIAGETVYADEH